MSFKNQAEIYQALLDGKTLECANDLVRVVDGTIVRSVGGNNEWKPYDHALTKPNYWSIYEPPKEKVKWYRVTHHPKQYKLPETAKCLYKTKEQFIAAWGSSSETDFHWITLEFVCEQEEV